MNSTKPSDETAEPDGPSQLVEHFFRHESANLVSVLTRAFGFSRFDLVEDMVQSATIEAMNSWKHRGIPNNPTGWIHRVARNRILDALRREKVHEQALAFAGIQDSAQTQQLLDKWLDEKELPDSLLRMMFVCCHPMLDRKSQIALTLKVLCGLSVAEISRGLLMNVEAVRKKIQRAKAQLAESNIAIEYPEPDQLQQRLSVVHDVLYLMFNEGYSTSHGIEPVRDDVCEEAARLCHMLCENKSFSNPTSRALLSLMLFHASRLDGRVNSDGNIVLLGEQDRSKWDYRLIEVATNWLHRSQTTTPSRFHFEAVIAKLHCSATSVEETDWQSIIHCYDRLLESISSPIYKLNRAIAISQTGDIECALAELETIRASRELRNYYLLDCAAARFHEMAGNNSAAIDAYLTAMSGNIAEHQKALIEKRIKSLAK